MTLVFVHGAGFTGSCFAHQIADFPDSDAPDLPGRDGRPVAASIDDFAAWLEAHIRARQYEDVTLCGHSMGGAVALAVALRNELRLRSIVLLGSGARLRVAPAILDGLDHSFQQEVRRLAGLFFAAPSPERIQWASALMLAVGRKQTLNDFRACDAFDVADSLDTLSLPVLAITGQDDMLMPPKRAQALTDRVPGAVTRIIPGAGHFVMTERPAETNATLRTFLEGAA